MNQIAFQYLAIDKRGQKVKGFVRATAEAEAMRQLSAQNLTPVTIKRSKIKTKGSKKVRSKDIAQFTYQLSVLINARIPIGEGIRSIAEQEHAGKFREMLLSIAAKIESGDRIAVAMAEHEKLLGPVYVQTIHAAEQSGSLVKVLEYLSEMTEKQQEMRSQVRGALMYPACVVGVLLLGVTFLIAFVVPKFARMFEGRGIELPIFTKLLMHVGESVQGYWWAYLLVIAGSIFTFRQAMRNPRGRRRIEAALHKIPYLNKILVGLAVSRFARVFGLCLSSGLSLLDGLKMAGRSAGGAALQADVERIADQVRSGSKMATALAMCSALPPFAKRMLISGEESAELPRMCGVISRQYERETSALVKNIATVIEPVLIVLIAVVVLIVALAIFLPMWNMVQIMER